MTTNIFQWSCSVPKGLAGLTTLKGVDGQWAIDIKRGRSLPEEFPSDAYFEMDQDHPKDVKLGEQHYNGERMVLIGKRLSEFVEELGEPSLQLLPVKVMDHKGRVASSDFNIVHTVGLVDCLDPAASKAVWNPIDPELIMSWGTLTLKDGDHEFPKVFRVKGIPTFTFVREDVAKAVKALGFKEPYFKRLADM